jgi:hypothetical protein
VDQYQAYLDAKTHANDRQGFEPVVMPEHLFPFQRDLVQWAVEHGRAAIFADCGLGKTPMQLAWADNVHRHTGKPVLILTPLAVAGQVVSEAHKFGHDAARSPDGRVASPIVVTNYERLHLFNPEDFGGVVCDESSILKSFDGARRTEITAFMRKQRYRLLATATAAPNDWTELGTSSEALGYLGYMDMLNKFFRNDLNNSAVGQIGGRAIQWRLKGHAERPFWRWVCSWARAVRKPSDLGHDDGAFNLPPLVEREHIVESATLAEGMLFALPAIGLQEQREERRRTIPERCERAASMANATTDPVTVWCHLNDEANKLRDMVPDAVEVSGADSDDEKEAKLTAFATGNARVLITKPKIGAWGLNFQHCAHVITFPSHSFEQYYQSVRRSWRFGQTRPVLVDIVASEGERGVLANLQRKQDQADQMFENLVQEMNNAIAMMRPPRQAITLEVPQWL